MGSIEACLHLDSEIVFIMTRETLKSVATQPTNSVTVADKLEKFIQESVIEKKQSDSTKINQRQSTFHVIVPVSTRVLFVPISSLNKLCSLLLMNQFFHLILFFEKAITAIQIFESYSAKTHRITNNFSWPRAGLNSSLSN